MSRILIVCTANICRSPVVSALLKQRLDERGYQDWIVESAGTWAVVSRGAAQNSIQLMKDQGIDITQHRARMVDEFMIAESDLILCMELGHVEALKIEFKDDRQRIFALSQMVNGKYSIADPYGGSLNDYKEMVAEVTQILDTSIERIIALTQRLSTMRQR